MSIGFDAGGALSAEGTGEGTADGVGVSPSAPRHAFRRAELAASAARHAFPIGDVSPLLAPSAPPSDSHSAHSRAGVGAHSFDVGPSWHCARSTMPAAVGVEAGRSSIGLTAPNELGVELRDGNRRRLYPDELFDSPTGSPASADRLHEEPGPSPAALGVCSRSSSGLTHPNESGVQLQLPERTRACGDRNMGASATRVSPSKCSAALPSVDRRLKALPLPKKGQPSPKKV